MNTKLIMTLSALALVLIGITLTFLPREIAGYLGGGNSKSFEIVLQILGALYFGFAMLDWMAKGSIIGGIYNRPISIANFTHFLIGALALVKAMTNGSGLPEFLWILAGFYALFALLFALILFGHPSPNKKR